MTDTNERGEFTGPDGKLYHLVGTPQDPGFATHQGPWLTCDGCNPVVVVEPQDDPATGTSRLIELRGRYAAAKQAADAAAETLKTATNKLKSALTEASGGAYRVTLKVEGFKPLNLTYVESWRINTKRFKAEQPAVYVEYAERSGSWRLEQSKAQS